MGEDGGSEAESDEPECGSAGVFHLNSLLDEVDIDSWNGTRCAERLPMNQDDEWDGHLFRPKPDYAKSAGLSSR